MPVQVHKSVFTALISLYQQQTSVRTNVIGVYTRILLPGMRGNTPSGYLLANGTISMHFPVHFYTNARVIISFMMFYDVTLQPAIEANPSRISPNHTCQYSLLTLSCNINSSHFSLHTTFKIQI